MDAETKKLLDRGARMTELLKQSQKQIYKLSAQVALLLAYGENLLQNIPTQKVGDFAEKLLAHLYSQAVSGMKTVDTTKRLSQSGRRTLTGIIRDFAKSYEA